MTDKLTNFLLPPGEHGLATKLCACGLFSAIVYSFFSHPINSWPLLCIFIPILLCLRRGLIDEHGAQRVLIFCCFFGGILSHLRFAWSYPNADLFSLLQLVQIGTSDSPASSALHIRLYF
jgi:hypothetical protein